MDGQAGVQEETSTQRNGASKDRITRNTPQTGTHTLQGEGQPSTGHHEEEQDQVPVFRLGHRDEKGSEPGGESFRGGFLKKQHLRTLPSRKPQKCTSSNQVVNMKIILFQLFNLSTGTITGMPAPMSQLSEFRLAARVSMWSRYRRAPVSKKVKYPSSRKRRPTLRSTSWGCPIVTENGGNIDRAILCPR